MIDRLVNFLRRRGIDCETFGTVFDIGSRDGLQAIELSELFPAAKIIAVECNPATIDLCRANVAPHPRIQVVSKAINSHTGRCAFYPTDPLHTVTTYPDGNPGASSLFVATGDYPAERYVQSRIEVDCTRLDDLCRQQQIDVVDLIWIDLQGAELLALQSAGKLLDKVRYIFTEVSFRPLYQGQCLFDDLNAFLTARGFRCCSKFDRTRWQQDLIYENTRDLIDVLIPGDTEDRDFLKLSVRSVYNCVENLRRIYLAGKADPEIEGTSFFSWRHFPFDQPGIARVAGSDQLASEYLQQLIKLYFPLVNRSCLPDLLVVDPGTIFLDRCRFLDHGRPVFSFGDHYHEQHFAHMTRLDPELHRMFAYSGISKCVPYRREWVRQLHDSVATHHHQMPFWRAYLDAAKDGEPGVGASEAEIYFNFCLMFHAGDLILRRSRWKEASRTDDVVPDTLDYVSLPPDIRNNRRAARDWEPVLFSNLTALDTKDARACTIYAGRLFDAKRFTEASDASDQALAIDPSDVLAARHGIHARLHSCDWRRRHKDTKRISAGLSAGENIIASVFHRAISGSEAESRMLAGVRAKDFPVDLTPLWRGEKYHHRKIRIAYLSSDFREHVVSNAIAGVFELHDKSRFETTAISLLGSDESPMRRRLEAVFDRFIHAESMSDRGVAAMLREYEIDIAVDLNGYSGKRRTGILARRPAPVQVSYLGYPGTMGVPFIDYIIADRIVIPPENRANYSESVICLPHTYLPAELKTIPAAPSRREAGLPDSGFIFACFNYIYKINPEMFDIWMRLLGVVDNSILWLRSDNNDAIRNLQREAATRGVAANRLVFAPLVPKREDHLARLSLADLFLDTLPYNAHVTATDALGVGVPVITFPGATFPGRVATSALHALGLPELVTSSPGEYEELALALALNPAQLEAIKSKLIRNRETAPLFDTTRFVRNLEAAYTIMWERQQSGLPAEPFPVEA